jgi:hypothetical protein
MGEVLRSDDRSNAPARGVRLSRPIRLLVTARDVAAALHLVQVARAAQGDARFDVSIAAQEPAAHHFAAAGFDLQRLPALSVTSAQEPAADRLRQTARSVLQQHHPDAVLVGLSTPFDAGLDEAVLAETTVPSSLLQDFWGEQNLILGRGADQILGIDAQAAERNAARYAVPTVVVGSPRHAAYAGLDIGGIRARMRASIGIKPQERVIGFFGQALHSLAGYRRTIEHFIASARELGPGIRVTLRPHPRESHEQRRETEALFEHSGLAVTLDTSANVESALAACDVVVSLFSICTFDASYLNRFASEPVAVPMSLLFDQEIADYCRQHGNYIDFSHHTLGLVIPVYQAGELVTALGTAATPAACREAWARAHRFLPDPSQAPQNVLDAIAAQVDARQPHHR